MRKIVLAVIVAIAVLAALTAACLYIPGGPVRLQFEEGDIRVCLNRDGSIDLDWPEVRQTAPGVLYRVDARCGDVHIRQDASTPGTRLGQAGLPMELRIQAAAESKSLLGLTRRIPSAALAVRVGDASLNAPSLTGAPSPEKLTLSWTTEGQTPDFYEIFSLEDNGQAVLLATTEAQSLELHAGRTEGDLLLSGQPFDLTVRAGIRGTGYVLCGPASNMITVEPQELIESDLHLACRETDAHTSVLEWDETWGETYEVREWRENAWSLLDTLEPTERFSYDLGHLDSGTQHRYQVTSKDKNGDVFSVNEITFYAPVDPLYATIWPITGQTVYQKPDRNASALGTIPGGTALCVLEEQGDWFQVRYKDRDGYIDSRFCMINLPEYLGDHCAYDITNSYRSVFKVHENPIALITDQVIAGFENVREADGGFLVPYLYPSARKLYSAAQAAEADGYRLKIYEAFRPNEATRYLYDTMSQQLDWAALAYDGTRGGVKDPVTGWAVELSDGKLTDPATGERYERKELPSEAAESETQYDSYAGIMTDNGRFHLSSFLARTVSAHNWGIALDLTLERIDTGEELRMQSAIHDLSWYSATYSNNDNAKLLKGYMTACGMQELSSEWWHFQDDETRKAIGLNSYLSKGVDISGWTRDAQGWRYRDEKGRFFHGTTITVDGKQYALSADGYLQT